jgi:hypothetical protein
MRDPARGTLRVAICALVIVAGAHRVHADNAASEMRALPRPPHYSVGVGGLLTLAGSTGALVAAQLEVLPGGRVGRLGGLALVRASQGAEQGLLALGAVYEAAAARPRLWLELHAEVGATWGTTRPVGGGGIIAHVALWGPIGLALDTGLHIIYGGTDTELVLATTALIALAR